MFEIKKYAVSDISKIGLSAVMRTATEEGFCIITKNGEPSVMMMPLSLTGMRTFVNRMLSEADKDSKIPTEIKDIFGFYKQMLGVLETKDIKKIE
jgi:hypothetical protein